MRKYILCIGLMLNCVLSYAQDFFVQTSCEYVSSYIYHGTRLGNFSIQPDINFNYYGFYADLWLSVGSESYRHNIDASECDIKVGYSNYGLDASYKHISALNELNCFSYRKSSATGWLCLSYDFGYYTQAPICISTFTHIIGSNNKFSTYIETKLYKNFSYDILLYGAIGVKINDNDCNISCIEAKLSKLFKAEFYNYDIYIHGMINPYQICSANLITFDIDLHLNACIGLVISLK